jgi:hypothetical protein
MDSEARCLPSDWRMESPAAGHGNPLYRAMRDVERRSRCPANRLKSIVFDKERCELLLRSASSSTALQRALRSQRELAKIAKKEQDGELEDEECRLRSEGEVCGSLAVFANQRCGAWYCPARHALRPRQCYFKSADGHYGSWAMGEVRLNLNVLDACLALDRGDDAAGVAAIVDATQHGKRFPDALSKTVPMWVVTVNALCATQETSGSVMSCADMLRRSFPPWVTDNEVAAIGKLVPQFSLNMRRHLMDAFGGVLPTLSRRLQCVWLSAAEEAPPNQLEGPSCDGGLRWGNTIAAVFEEGCLPVALVCASGDARSQTSTQDQIGGRCGWCYIPGAADDHDSWARGLSSTIFWQHCAKHLQQELDDDAVEELIDRAVCNYSATETPTAEVHVVKLSPRLALLEAPECPDDQRQRLMPVVVLREQRSATTLPDVCVPEGEEGRSAIIGIDTQSTGFGLERALASISALCESMRAVMCVETVTIVGSARLAGSAAVALLAAEKDPRPSEMKEAVKGAQVAVARALGEGALPRTLMKQVNRFLMPRPQ